MSKAIATSGVRVVGDLDYVSGRFAAIIAQEVNDGDVLNFVLKLPATRLRNRYRVVRIHKMDWCIWNTTDQGIPSSGNWIWALHFLALPVTLSTAPAEAFGPDVCACQSGRFTIGNPDFEWFFGEQGYVVANDEILFSAAFTNHTAGKVFEGVVRLWYVPVEISVNDYMRLASQQK